MANFLQSELFSGIILPFLFIFSLFFAILEKSKLLGDEKRQINAIISFVIAGILIGFGKYVGWIQQFTIFLVIAITILFIFMLIYSFAYGDKEGDPFKEQKWIKLSIAGVALIALVIATLVITDTWDKVYDFFSAGSTGQNIIFIILIVAAIAAVLYGGKGETKKD